jgi:hypothetical protein
LGTLVLIVIVLFAIGLGMIGWRAAGWVIMLLSAAFILYIFTH